MYYLSIPDCSHIYVRGERLFSAAQLATDNTARIIQYHNFTARALTGKNRLQTQHQNKEDACSSILMFPAADSADCGKKLALEAQRELGEVDVCYALLGGS